MIKVQFPDLHEQFRNAKAFTIMASKLGEVLDIEAADSYIKRPVGPMVTVEVQDISKLAGFIRIPSMAKGAATTNSIRQKTFYSGLSNQCRRCRKFRHHARACNTSKTSPRERSTQHNPPPNASTGEALDPREEAQGTAHASKLKPPSRVPSDPHVKRSGRTRADAPTTTGPPRTLSQPTGHANPHIESLAQVSSQRRLTSNNLRDQEMSKPSEPPTRLKSETQPEAEQLTAGGSTPNAKLHFGFPRLKGTHTQTLEANANPFASSGEGNKEVKRHNRPHVEAMEGWSFQGKRRHTPKLASPR